VFAAINSTPATPSSIIRLIALPPPPPTPITLITAPCTDAVSNENAIFIPHLLFSQTYFQKYHEHAHQVLVLILLVFELVEPE
jgi:hypothetical protein